MANKKNEIGVGISAGPSEMQLMMSLMRNTQGQHGLDIDRVTSVRFTTLSDKLPEITAFNACIDGMSRECGSGNSWNIEGYVFDPPFTGKFKGHFNTKLRKGFLNLTYAE